MNDTRDIDNLTGREIAVIGMAGRFPGARNLKEFRRFIAGDRTPEAMRAQIFLRRAKS